jgi:hypothetical protein
MEKALERLPEVDTWRAAFRARPSYSKTFYFGSLLTEEVPGSENIVIRRGRRAI